MSLSRNVTNGIAEVEELADVVAAAAGIANQGQRQRIAQRLSALGLPGSRRRRPVRSVHPRGGGSSWTRVR